MMDNTWRRIEVFVSSTFKDMDAERDALKLEVCRRLNERYRSSRIDFQFIDLRIGIDTERLDEEEAEDKVLEVCLESIERSRPFFIGLVGGRYGWVPPRERWEAVVNRLSEEHRTLVCNGVGRSVTELEILYGAIGNHGENINRSLFFFRDDSSYDKLPPTLKPTFCETDSQKQERLRQMKAEIVEECLSHETEMAIMNYRLAWDSDRKTFDGIYGEGGFADIVYQRICQEIDSYVALQPAVSWIEEELATVESLVHANADNLTPTNNLQRLVQQMECSPSHVCLCGKHGMGKTVVMSQMYRLMAANAQNICLIAYAGASEYSRLAVHILIRWTEEINRRLGHDAKTDIDYLGADYEKAVAEFHEVVTVARRKGFRVVAFIDNLDAFGLGSGRDIYLTWLNDDIDFVGTVSEEYLPVVRLYNSNIHAISINEIDKADLQRIISQFGERYNLLLPEKARLDLSDNTNTSGLRIALLLRLIANFTRRDIHEIKDRTEGSDIAKINRHIEDLIARAPLARAALMQYFLQTIMWQIEATDDYLKALQYIALSEVGLTDEQISELLPAKIGNAQFRNFAYLLSDFITEHPYSRRWIITNKTFAAIVRPEQPIDMYRDLYHLIASLPENSLLHSSVYPYIALKAHASGAKQVMAKANGDRSYFQQLYFGSRHLLLTDRRIYDDVKEFCKCLSYEERIFMVNGMMEAFGFVNAPVLCLKMAEVALGSFDTQQLSCTAAYKLGWICSQCKNYERAIKATQSARVEPIHNGQFFLSKAVEAYQRCYNLSPTYRDTRNMLKAMMSENMAAIMDSGDWDMIDKYINQINNL